MIWKKRDGCKTVKDVVERNTGLKIEDFINPKKNPSVHNLDRVVNRIKLAIKNKEKITVVTDYDCDGVTSAAIMFLMFKELGIVPKIRLPKRFSEGYGLSEKIIDEVDSGLLITVDNGISAYNEIEAAKEKGLDVIVIDHHITDNELPPADVIIDPHIVGKSEFEHYCGAGLSYRIAKELLPEKSRVMKVITSIAAIGTVADVVPLIGDNRNIVISGIDYINQGFVTAGLKSLLKQLKIQSVDETTIGFTLAPIFNAQGRLYDNGASISYRILASESEDTDKLDKISLELIATNNNRKSIVSEAYESIQTDIKKAVESNLSAIIINIKEIGEGVIGILAGKIAEDTHRPCFVFTNSEANGVLKGSGRTYGNINIKLLLDKVNQECYLKYGGHPGAAGVSVYAEKFEEFKRDFLSFCDEVSDFDFDTVYYDLEIDESEIDSVYEEVKKYAPYGQSNESIVFCLKDFTPTQKFGAKYKAIGENHIKIFGKTNDALGFGLYQKFKDVEENDKWNLLGDMSENTFNGKTTIQFMFRDIS